MAYDAIVSIATLEALQIDVARISCDVDLASAPTIERYLIELMTTARPTIVALDGCTFFDSSGVAMLVRLERTFNGSLAILATRGSRARRVLDLTSAKHGLRVRDSMDAAFDSLRRFVGKSVA